MSIDVASNAARRWALAAPIITDGSPTGTVPMRCQITTRPTP